MDSHWRPEVIPEREPLGLGGGVRAGARLATLSILLSAGLAVLLLLRLAERPFWKNHRPISPFVTQGVSRAALAILGVSYRRHGHQMEMKGGVVANHASWLDIFALNAGKRIYFVAKSEVARWPGIGWLARATGTVFIRRSSQDAKRQQSIFEQRLSVGHKLLFFPEGTSSDGSIVLPFKSTLFEAFFTTGESLDLWIQPVSVVYSPPKGAPHWFYGWWGEMDFLSHLLRVAAAPRRGRVEVIYHPPLRVADFPNRKALAKACEATVRAGHASLSTAKQGSRP